MLKLRDLTLLKSRDALRAVPEGKVLINTINAHSFNVAQKDAAFAEALRGGDYLIPDGASIVKASRLLKIKDRPVERVAGWDLFCYEMERLETRGRTSKAKQRVMFMGSSERVLERIRERAATDYPHLEIVTYSPPYKAEFSEEDSADIIRAVNEADPDLLWIGMTAPKQEKWTWRHWDALRIHCHTGTVGAVFDFYAGTMKRAPRWWQEHSLEWAYRLFREPRRMWRRYLVGNPLFAWNVLKEYLCS